MVSGRAFYQNGTVWTDSTAQQKRSLRQKRITFAGPRILRAARAESFAFLMACPWGRDGCRRRRHPVHHPKPEDRMKTITTIVMTAALLLLTATGGFAATKPRVEVAFVLDSTGSMGGLIEGAKEKIWSIANDIVKGKPGPRREDRPCHLPRQGGRVCHPPLRSHRGHRFGLSKPAVHTRGRGRG